MAYARGELLSRVLWRTKHQLPSSRIITPSVELGLASRPLPRAAYSNPSFIPVQRPNLLVIGAPGGGNADVTAGQGTNTTAHVDPTGSISLSPEVKHGIATGLGFASLIPGVGIIAAILSKVVQALPLGAPPAQSALPSAPDNPDPTGSSAGVTAQNLADAQAALNDAAAAMGRGDYNAAMSAAERADRLAGGVLGAGSRGFGGAPVSGQTGLATDWGRTMGAPAPAGQPDDALNINEALNPDALSAEAVTSSGATGPNVDSYAGDPMGADLAGVSGAGTAGVDAGGAPGGATGAGGGVDVGSGGVDAGSADAGGVDSGQV